MRSRARNFVGAASGVVALSVVAFFALGLIWGLSYPTYRGTVVSGGAMEVDAGSGQEFRSWALLVFGSGALSAAMAVAVFLRSARSRGLAMQLWLAVTSVVGTVLAYDAGLWLARLRLPVPSLESLHPGDTIEMVGAVSLGAPIAVLFPALMSTLAYWSCAVVSRSDEVLDTADPARYYNQGAEIRP
ncbi:hypothetical protein [Corynebacterium lowii]|uniref:DUF2567 domain-containing protein n=1 Tax=Corynebacterium lowii TaxID=1544413 RepID=A0A0Q0UFB4_9CORY|nr:hypothetical protein [Corynebacterium lowii]KQB86711.1 hypothetical protein Clow_00919 [Corynebacterium lowii]MDP9851397.1 hypothetical protein [Corynebacterium lowii]